MRSEQVHMLRLALNSLAYSQVQLDGTDDRRTSTRFPLEKKVMKLPLRSVSRKPTETSYQSIDGSRREIELFNKRRGEGNTVLKNDISVFHPPVVNDQ